MNPPAVGKNVLGPRPVPGTPEFREALVDALQEYSKDRGNGSIEISAAERVSRNTVIYHGVIHGQRVIAKAQLTKSPSVVTAEYRMLRDMEDTLRGSRVRGLRPVTVLEDLGVLITVEEQGETLRTVIEAACRNPEVGWRWAVTCVVAAAHALRTFHDAYERPSRSGSTEQSCVRWYLDFSPKNILIQDDGSEHDEPGIVLLDAPEEERWGSRCEDIGGFCYDMTRICFLPEFLFKRSVSHTIDRLKACFIRSYCESTHVASQGYPLREIEAAEYRRASQALIWYTKPWRYDAVMKEVLRLCYLGPLTALYRTRGLPRSYRTAGQLLGKPQ